MGDLENAYPGIVSNVHVKALILEKDPTFNNNDLTDVEVSLLYKVVKGIGHESLGIHVAQVVGFPLETIKAHGLIIIIFIGCKKKISIGS